MLTMITDTLAIDPKLIIDVNYEKKEVIIELSTGKKWILHSVSKRSYNNIIKRVNRAMKEGE